MVETLRQEQHISEKDNICPYCGLKGSIIFWKMSGSNVDLFGKKIDNWKKINPTCKGCGKVYSKGTMFRKQRA